MNHQQRQAPFARRAKQACGGVTLTELLVVLAIIGLLAAIAVPMYLNHQEMAKVRVAIAECKQLAEAEERCAIRHGFYAPLQLLDDLAPGDETDKNYDDLANSRREFGNVLYFIDPAIRPDIQFFGARQPRIDFYLPGATFSRRIADLYWGWDGPFINVHRKYYGQDFVPNIPQALTDRARALDWPLDPWGNPYRFYSSLGIIGTDARWDTRIPASYSAALETITFGDGLLTQTGFYAFDRYAVVSYGPDGAEGAITVAASAASVQDPRNDDIIYMFGRIPNETAYRLF